MVLSAQPADWQGFIDTLHIRSRMRRITGSLRLSRSNRGYSLPALDMLIAARVNGLILVSHDDAFGKIDGLAVED